MNKLKKFVINEIKTALDEEKKRRKKNEIMGSLYEAVNTTGELKRKLMKSKNVSEGKRNYKKYKLAEKLTESLVKKLQTLKENGQYEGEGRMAKAQLLAIMDMSKMLYHMIEDETVLEDWLQYKLSIAENYLDAVYGYMKYFNGVEDMEEKEFEEEEYYDDVEEDDDDELSDEEIDSYFPDDYTEYGGEDEFEEFDDLDDDGWEDVEDDDDDDDDDFIG